MKRLIIAAILLGAGFCVSAKEKKNPLMASDTVMWAGLDYSMVRMISKDDFKVPDIIFPGMLEKWNALFIEERIELVAKALDKRVLIDIGGVTERNKKATADQIVSAPGLKDTIEESHISQQDIAAAVQSYKLEKKSGLGLVFIVDRLVSKKIRTPYGTLSYPPTEARGSVYVVFFDVAKREVISVKREVHGVSSRSNFRNFWFGPIKDADETLKRYR